MCSGTTVMCRVFPDYVILFCVLLCCVVPFSALCRAIRHTVLQLALSSPTQSIQHVEITRSIEARWIPLAFRTWATTETHRWSATGPGLSLSPVVEVLAGVVEKGWLKLEESRYVVVPPPAPGGGASSVVGGAGAAAASNGGTAHQLEVRALTLGINSKPESSAADQSKPTSGGGGKKKSTGGSGSSGSSGGSGAATPSDKPSTGGGRSGGVHKPATS